MDERTKNQKGSEAADEFKFQHKQRLSSYCWASDVDLVLIDSRGARGDIIAFIEFKRTSDHWGYTQMKMYQQLKILAPVFVVISDTPETGPFEIRRFESLDAFSREGPVISEQAVHCADWSDFRDWEDSMRQIHGVSRRFY